jgi:uncharacterized protein
MKSRRIHEANGQRTFVVILDQGDEAKSCLQNFASAEHISAAQVSAIGAFENATLAYFDWVSRKYEEHPVLEQTEVLSLLGDISQDSLGKPSLHLHAVLGRRDTGTVGGHLIAGRVRPTLEVVVTESASHLRRIHDPALGIALIKL